MTSITLPGYYIVQRKNLRGNTVEQHVKLESTTVESTTVESTTVESTVESTTVESTTEGNAGQTIYCGYYGIFGYHELCCKEENIRHMTEQEQSSHKKGEYWDLPQQFYQTFPGSPELNGPIETNRLL